MITVACVFWGNKFSLDYVYNLRNMVKRNTTVDHEFVCFSDKQIPDVKTHILKPGFNGWWNKLQMFNTEYPLRQNVVYFDLDTLITNNIDWLMQYNTMFMGIEDLGSVNAHQPFLRGQLQSGVLKWNRAMNGHIWQEFTARPDVMIKIRGDGEYLNIVLPNEKRELLQRVFPHKLKSYKYQVYDAGLDDNTSIVCFHGRPSIVESMTETVKTSMNTYKPQAWVQEHWR